MTDSADRKRTSFTVGWQEWLGILAICTISGMVLGIIAFLLGRPPLPLGLLLEVAIGAFVIALLFAFVGSVMGAALVILVAEHGAPTASRLRLIATGATAGAIVGGLHPFVIMVAVVARLSPDPALPGLRLGALVVASGAVAGAFIAPMYLPKIRARREP